MRFGLSLLLSSFSLLSLFFLFFLPFFSSFFFLFFFFFSLSDFLFFNLKNGRTPLYIAAANGHEQIVQTLLEKENPNVDLATKVILLILLI